MSISIPKVTKSGYDLTQKLISIYFPLKKPNLNNDIKQNRIVGGTDYEKFEKIAIEVEREDILSKRYFKNGKSKRYKNSKTNV